MITIDAIKAFSDNYIWCFHDEAGRACIVDPGEAAPVEAFLADNGLTLSSVLITHHHFDHVGALPELTARRNLKVIGPATSAPQINQAVTDGDTIEVFGVSFQVIAVPGHTLDHIAFYAPQHNPPLLFCGDTLFAGGCGRLFEGTPEQMHASLAALKALPENTQVYCAHEYTLANLRFAEAVEPENPALKQRIARDSALREQDLPTVPSTLGEELQTNPFLRADAPSVQASAREYASIALGSDTEVFAAVRRWKDNF